MAAAARGGRLGVFTDFDGTISFFAPRPDLARIDPRCHDALAVLAPLLPVTGVVSGREVAALHALVGLPELFYGGSHGLTSWYRGEETVEPGAAGLEDLVLPAEADLAAALTGLHVRFERKRFGLAIHYRDDPDPAAARAAILTAITRSPAASAFVVHEGARVVELAPPLGASKGMMLRALRVHFGLTALVFFGDDITDADGFRTIRELRAKGEVQGWAVAALHPETAAEARALADAAVPAVTGVADALEQLARSLTP